MTYQHTMNGVAVSPHLDATIADSLRDLQRKGYKVVQLECRRPESQAKDKETMYLECKLSQAEGWLEYHNYYYQGDSVIIVIIGVKR